MISIKLKRWLHPPNDRAPQVKNQDTDAAAKEASGHQLLKDAISVGVIPRGFGLQSDNLQPSFNRIPRSLAVAPELSTPIVCLGNPDVLAQSPMPALSRNLFRSFDINDKEMMDVVIELGNITGKWFSSDQSNAGIEQAADTSDAAHGIQMLHINPRCGASIRGAAHCCEMRHTVCGTSSHQRHSHMTQLWPPVELQLVDWREFKQV
ncbi:hypothetical protein C8F04DRAFT_1182892 [Mycena alexandri]|uniref:Uncharacterized protein n=1 Tax=Mycena alexandri TaxID=1745969 RepID=A0AAD6SVN0_9AGAR|nr:hypothetical protein C8F04DRAFT_1182892 [Mycena alexandri]